MEPVASGEVRGVAAASPAGEIEPIDVAAGASLLCVDLEEWGDGSCCDDALFLLDLFARKQVRATFFVLGLVARRDPHLVRRIAAAGHEIASHGWDHEQVFRKTPARFRAEMERAHGTLSALAGRPVAGYRAPHFSIGRTTWWALDVLADVGFTYDSSVFPIAGPRYGVPDFPRGPVRLRRGGRALVEVPLATVRAVGRNVPVAGGGYFRLLPYRLIERAVDAVHADGLPFVSYCHPYEFRREPLVYPRTPGPLGGARAALLGAKFNFRRQTMPGKLARLLDRFPFTSIEEALGEALPRRRAAAEVHGDHPLH
jgi:polysaccharide deacetylase family protein (PEP-CTERM system associated)